MGHTVSEAGGIYVVQVRHLCQHPGLKGLCRPATCLLGDWVFTAGVPHPHRERGPQRRWPIAGRCLPGRPPQTAGIRAGGRGSQAEKGQRLGAF